MLNAFRDLLCSNYAGIIGLGLLQRRAAHWTLGIITITTVVYLPSGRILTGLVYNITNKARLSLFCKSLHNLIALEIPPYYIPNNHLSRLCMYHQLSYIHPYARTNTYKYSPPIGGQSVSGILYQQK